MSLFRCETCGCFENTALSNWAIRSLHKQPPLCSECDPEIGKWHGEWPKKSSDGMFVGPMNLYHAVEVAEGTYARSSQCTGRIIDGRVVPMTPEECREVALAVVSLEHARAAFGEEEPT